MYFKCCLYPTLKKNMLKIQHGICMSAYAILACKYSKKNCACSEWLLFYSRTKGVKQKYSQFICHVQQGTVIWNAITTL